MKKILVAVLAVAMILSAAAFSVSATEQMDINIYKTNTAPAIDGVINDGEYNLVDSWVNGTSASMTGTGDFVNKYEVYFYATYTDDAIYLAVKCQCDEHVAYMDNAAEHWIFNAHYLMNLIIPDDPAKENYTPVGDQIATAGSEEWAWGAANSSGYPLEYTTILNSKTNEDEFSNHFGTLIGTTGVEYKVTSADGWDVYEQKIPFSAMKNSANTEGLTSATGTVFGLSFQLGLTDIGTGYDDNANPRGNYIRFSHCYDGIGGKILGGCNRMILAGEKTTEPEESSAAPEESSAAPEESSTAPAEESSKAPATSSTAPVTSSTTQTGDNGIWVYVIISVVALAGVAFVIATRKKNSVSR